MPSAANARRESGMRRWWGARGKETEVEVEVVAEAEAEAGERGSRRRGGRGEGRGRRRRDAWRALMAAAGAGEVGDA